MKFERALEKLEQIVERMESGELSLEEALKSYEEGTKLLRLCTKMLEEARNKVLVLRESAEGMRAEEMGELPTEDLEGPRAGGRVGGDSRVPEEAGEGEAPGDAGEETGELFR